MKVNLAKIIPIFHLGIFFLSLVLFFSFWFCFLFVFSFFFFFYSLLCERESNWWKGRGRRKSPSQICVIVTWRQCSDLIPCQFTSNPFSFPSNFQIHPPFLSLIKLKTTNLILDLFIVCLAFKCEKFLLNL